MIKVLRPGLLTTVQDQGRKQYLAYGMPKSGVMDRYAANVANLLCSNPLSAAVLEMTVGGGSFIFSQAMRIAVCGAEMPLELNGTPIDAWTAIDVEAGDALDAGMVRSGCRCYLAVSGGIDVPEVMGSRSTYFRAGIGGYEGRPLKAEDHLAVLEAMPHAEVPVNVPADLIPVYGQDIILRLLLGPQDELFNEQGLRSLLESTFLVSGEADRMGYRLEGPAIAHRDKADIVSDALVPGAVQVPGNGQPIIMMVDCGTTGGYAKIATVISADLWKVAQAKPQDRVRFSLCEETEAVAALEQEMANYRRIAELVIRGERTAKPVRQEMVAMSLPSSSQAPELEPPIDEPQNVVPEPEMKQGPIEEQKSSAPSFGPLRKIRLRVDGKEYEIEIREVK